MKNSSKILAAALLGAVAMAGAAKAATVTITPVVVSYYTDADSGLATPLPAPANNGLAGTYQIDFVLSTSLSAADTAAGDVGFGNADFNVAFTGGATDSPIVPGYAGDGPVLARKNTATTWTKISGNFGSVGSAATPTSTANLFNTNADAGSDSTDLKDIQLLVNTASMLATDLRKGISQSSQDPLLTTYGQNPYDFGEIFVHFNGVGQASVGGAVVNTAVQGFSLLSSTNSYDGPKTGAGQTFSLPALTFTAGTVPEPTSLTLLALGGLVGIRRRRA